MNKREIKITEDGSMTIELIGFNEHFHSIHGAIQESDHIFIRHGLKEKAKELTDIAIFEMGFGTGLNALLSLVFAEKQNKNINYFTIEAFPIEKELVEKINFTKKLKLSNELSRCFTEFHSLPWNSKTQITANFCFEKQYVFFENLNLPCNFYDLVYFDAFNPDLQPELWTESVFLKLYQSMKKGGILMTYSAKGKVKRALKFAGFQLKALPGPIGKREITQAIKM